MADRQEELEAMGIEELRSLAISLDFDEQEIAVADGNTLIASILDDEAQ